MLKKIFVKTLRLILNSRIFNLINLIKSEYNVALTNRMLNDLKSAGLNIKLHPASYFINPKYISLGHNFNSSYNLRLEAFDEFGGQKFTPEIIIGNDVWMSNDIHIGATRKVIIGNNVLMASRIYISDHAHGEFNTKDLLLKPIERKLSSKGNVIIEDNVWIGEGVCILPGVTIGENSIVGANAVVTKNVPKNCIVAGVPAKIIKNITS